jgi:hypothetical protein
MWLEKKRVALVIVTSMVLNVLHLIDGQSCTLLIALLIAK